MLWPYYDQYLDYFYKKNPKIMRLSFSEHRQEIFNDHFGWPADLAAYMRKKGIDVEFIIENAEVLQKQWAVENDFDNFNRINWKKKIVLAQIKKFQPDLLWISNPTAGSYKYIDGASGNYKRLAFYLGHDISNKQLLLRADILFAINKRYVCDTYPKLNNVVYMGVGFYPEILNKLKLVEKKRNVVFLGNITPSHSYRAEVLAYLVENKVDIKIYGDIFEVTFLTKTRQIVGDIIKRKNFKSAFKNFKSFFTISTYRQHTDILKGRCLAPVFGMDYYRLLSSARVCINVHIDLAENFSGNMRMFEVTGVGTCLVSEEKPTNKKIFEIDKEMIQFNSKEKLLELLKNMNKKKYCNTALMSNISQERTLREYSIGRVFDRIKRHL